MYILINLFFILLTLNATAQNNCSFSIDSTAILNNSNLQNFIDSLDVLDFETKTNKKYIPKQVKKALQCWVGNFSIANPGKPYQIGCVVQKRLPKRQLIYMGVNDKYLMMAYRQGGLIQTYHLLLFNYNKESVIDFWAGYGADLDSKEEVLYYLKNFKDNLQSNYFFL